MIEGIKHCHPLHFSQRSPVGGGAQHDGYINGRAMPGTTRDRADFRTHGAPQPTTATTMAMTVQPSYQATSPRNKAPPSQPESVSAGFLPHPTVGQQPPKRARKDAACDNTPASSVEGRPEAKTLRPADNFNATAAQDSARKGLPVPAGTPSARLEAEVRTRKKNWRPHCQQKSCLRPASYACSSEKVPAFCEKHKMDGMQNVVHPNRGDCIHEGCARVSSYASTSDTLANYCHLHKKQGMVKVRDKIGTRCEEVTCVKQASFAMECQRYPRFCKDHKQQGMVNIRNHRCLAIGCSRGASFAVVGDRRGIYCGEHKLVGMVNTRRSRTQGVLPDRARQPEKTTVRAAAVPARTRSFSCDSRAPGLQPHIYSSSNGVGRNAVDCGRSPVSPSSSSLPSRIAIPGELGSPRSQGEVTPSPSSSSSPPSKMALSENFGSPRFQGGVEFRSPQTHGAVEFGSPRAQGGVPPGPICKRRRTSTDSEPILGTARLGHESVPSQASPRTRPWYRTLETKRPRTLVGASDDEQSPPAGMRASYAGIHRERFRKLVGSPGKRFSQTDSQASDAGTDARCDARAVGHRPSEADTRNDNGVVGHRRPSSTDARGRTRADDYRRVDADIHNDIRVVGYRSSDADIHSDGEVVGYRLSDADTHRHAGAVEYRRWSMSSSTSAGIERNASVSVNSDSKRCDSQLVHSANRASDSKRCGGQPGHAVNNRATSGNFATGTVVRDGREGRVEVVAEEPLSAAEISGDTHSDARAAAYRSSTAETNSDVGVVGHRSWGVPPKSSTRTTNERSASVFGNSDDRRCDGQSTPPANLVSDGERCGGQPAHPFTRGASGTFATGTAIRAGRGVEVVAKESPSAAKTSGKEFSERATSKSDVRSPQFLGCTTNQTTGIRLRFRVPYAPSFDDTQSVFPDTRSDTRQASMASGGVFHDCYDVPPDVGDAPPPSARPTNRDTRYATTKKPDNPSEKGGDKLPAQEQSTAIWKGGNLESSQSRGYARTSFYFNLVKALTKKLEARERISAH